MIERHGPESVMTARNLARRLLGGMRVEDWGSTAMPWWVNVDTGQQVPTDTIERAMAMGYVAANASELVATGLAENELEPWMLGSAG